MPFATRSNMAGMLTALPGVSPRGQAFWARCCSMRSVMSRDGNGAAHRAVGLSPDEGKCQFDVESAPGLVRRTG